MSNVVELPTKPASMALAAALRAARRRRGKMNQHAAAEALGVSRTSLARWELGHHPSTSDAETIKRIADFMGVSPDEVLRLMFLPDEPSQDGHREADEVARLRQEVQELRDEVEQLRETLYDRLPEVTDQQQPSTDELVSKVLRSIGIAILSYDDNED